MKTKILNMLKEHENTFLSGEEISETLHLSRQAVSKHIKNLKDQGHQIESISRKGHRYLSTEAEIYNLEEISSELTTAHLGKTMVFLDSIGSTNDYAKQIASNQNDYTVVIADEQTAGKGRLGRNWTSEKGTGIWLSIILKPDIEPSDAPKITQIAAAAMVKAIIEETALDIKIKWPNDLILNKKKVCGILTEMSAELGGINYVVVGIGLNVNQTSFSEDLADKATSLKMIYQKNVSRKKMVLSFFKHFEYLYGDFINNQSLDKTVDICKKNSILMNQMVRLITKSSTREVEVVDLNNQGQLVIINEFGIQENVFYGEVSVRGLYEYVD